MITPAVNQLRERLSIPGMKVLQFAFGDPGAHVYLPHNYPNNCVVYTGTHDNDTTLGWWQSGAGAEERAHAQAYLGGTADVPWEFIRAAYTSVARLAIVPFQDVLGLGSEARMNLPSRPDGNWGWRFAAGAVKVEMAERLAGLSTMCDRAPTVSAGEQGHGEVREDFAA
jgi:4-alpha-glucanotransferase